MTIALVQHSASSTILRGKDHRTNNMPKIMPVKGQRRLTDHFPVRKALLRPQKNGKVISAKISLEKESIQPAAQPVEKIISSVNLRKGVKRKLESEVKIVQDVVKKVKLGKKASNREELNETKNKLTSLPKEFSINEGNFTSTKSPAKEHQSHSLDVKPSLSLPDNCRLLVDMFRAMDVAISMLFNRKESCLFLKIKKSVEGQTRRTFDLKHLRQIKTVFPEAYDIRPDKCIAIDRETYGNYHYVITPTFHTSEIANKGVTKMMPSLQEERKKQFLSRITEIVKNHNKVKVLEIPLADIEAIPNVTTEASAKEVLDENRRELNKKFEAALEIIQQKQAIAPTSTSVKKVKDPFKGIPQFLLDKVRAKGMARKQRFLLTRPPEVTKEMAMLAKLPEMARIIKSYFTTAKKASIEFSVVRSNIEDSLYTALSPEAIDQHVKLLAERASDWIKLLTVKKMVYVKIDKAMDLNLVLAKLQ